MRTAGECTNAAFLTDNLITLVFSHLKHAILALVFGDDILLFSAESLGTYFAYLIKFLKNCSVLFQRVVAKLTIVCFEHFAFRTMSAGFVSLIRLLENTRIMPHLIHIGKNIFFVPKMVSIMSFFIQCGFTRVSNLFILLRNRIFFRFSI